MKAIDPEIYAPPFMRSLEQWCIYRLVENVEPGKKPSKIPYEALHPRCPAKSNSPKSWCDLPTALESMQANKADGVSFMMQEGNGLVFVDLDNCRNPDTGYISPWAMEWVNRFSSYTEVSTSGTGLHILIFAKMKGGGRKDDKKGVEIYYKGRQVCMSPNVYKGFNNLMHCQEVFNEFTAEFFPDYTGEEREAPIADIDGAMVVNEELLQKHIEAFCSKELRKAYWYQVGLDEGEDVSQSAIDWNIALFAVDLGFTNEVIAALITRNREMHGGLAKLAKHKNYLAITIGNARDHVLSKESLKAAKQEANSSLMDGAQWGSNGSANNNENNVMTNVQKSPAAETNVLVDALGPDFKMYSCDEVMKNVKPVQWLADKYIPLDSIVWIAGKPSAGKSFFILALAMAVCSGASWGCVSVQKGGVAYICGEGHNGLGKRLKGLRQEMAPEAVPNLTISSDPVILSKEKEVLALIDRLDELYNDPSRDPLKLIVFDTKTTCLDANENDSEAMGKFIRSLRKFQRRYNCTVLVVDHVSKANANDLRGSTVQMGAAEVVYMISRNEDDVLEAGTAFSSTMTVLKPPKDFEEPDSLEFDARRVDITLEGEDHTTLVALPKPARLVVSPMVARDTLTGAQERCLSILEQVVAQRVRDNLDSGGVPHAQLKVTVSDWRRACAAAEVKPTTLKRETKFLIDNRLVCVIAPDGDVKADKTKWYCAPMIKPRVDEEEEN